MKTINLWILMFSLQACKAEAAPEPVKVLKVPQGVQYLENSRVKLGIDLSIGGAVTYLSDRDNGGKNMINSADWGRQIQLSYYSGPAPFIGPKGEQPSEAWAGLGWNPIQSGDYGGNRSKVLEFEYRGDNAMFVRCQPMQWPHTAGISGDCEFECLYTLTGNVFTLEATIVNKRPDKTQYSARHQEMPALYTNGPWYKLVTYLGDQPFSNRPVTTLVDKNDGKGWPWLFFYSPEQWVALLDDNGKGIGVFQPDAMLFDAGFHGGDALKGTGDEKSGQTGYIAPVTSQILDHNIRWTYTTAFVLGTVDDIRNYAKSHRQTNLCPEWVFRDSRLGWYYEGNAHDTGWPLPGMLDFAFSKNAVLTRSEIFWKAEDAPVLEIEGAFATADKQLTLIVELRPTDEKKNSFSISQPVNADGVNRTSLINLSVLPDYNGAIKGIKLKFSDEGSAKIKRIKFRSL
ncbi:hypothetical protein EZS27_004535 [termite gut metagenome]|uniref:Uncharacterized protein n=1 Tax=termite gut metagenome TaxID=433724 RepID=A0A5J4SQ10_9ZZZZ